MKRDRYSELAAKLQPHLRVPGSATTVFTGGGASSFDDLSGVLREDQIPWLNERIAAALAPLKPHNVVDPLYHNVEGPQYALLGLTALNTLGLLTSTSDGLAAPNTILRSGPAGDLTIGHLNASMDLDDLHYLGRAAIGAMLALDTASFGHLDHPTVPALTQDQHGYTQIKGATGQAISLGVDAVQLRVALNELRLFPTTRIQTDHFISQLTGWRMTYAGELDTRYVYADQMKIKTFIADIEVALAGSQIVSKSVTTLSRPFVAPVPGLNAWLYLDDLPSAENMMVLEDGDIVRVREFSRAGGGLFVTDAWGTVSAYENLAGKEQLWLFKRGGAYVSPAPVQTMGGIKTGTSSSTNLTVAGPDTGVALAYAREGDQMLAALLLESTTITTTAPAGWTLIQTATVTGMRFSLYAKRRGASEPTSYTWVQSSGADAMVMLVTYRDVNLTSTITASIAFPQETATAFPTIKSLTPVREPDRYIAFVAARANRAPVIKPDAWSSDYGSYTFGGNTLAGFDTLAGESAGTPFGDVSAALTGGTARTITITVNLTGKDPELDLESGYMTPGTTIGAGAIVLDYGKDGDGWHEISAIDGYMSENAPYSRVVSWSGHPATGAVVRTQSGNLNGVFGEGREYGFYAGDGPGLANQYIRMSNTKGATLNNLAIRMYKDGIQRVYISPDGQDIWVGPSSFDKRISWNGATLALKGAMTIDSPSGFAGSGYLQIGAGVKDSTLSGWHMSTAEMVGQLVGVDQIIMGLDGRLYAGAGAVYLDATGANTLNQTTEVRTAHNAARGYTFRRSDNFAVIGRLTGSYLSGIDQYGIDLYAMAPNAQKAKAVFGAQYFEAIYGGGSPGAPRVEAYSDPATMDYLRLYSAGKFQVFNSGSATPDIDLWSSLLRIAVNARIIGALDISNASEFMLAPGSLSIGRRGHNYAPTTVNWSTNGSTLLLTGDPYTTIGFHDADTRVDYIRVGGGLITLGYDGGWGGASVAVGGTLRTQLGVPWNLGGYTAGAPTPTGYITVNVNGANYRIAAQAV